MITGRSIPSVSVNMALHMARLAQAAYHPALPVETHKENLDGEAIPFTAGIDSGIIVPYQDYNVVAIAGTKPANRKQWLSNLRSKPAMGEWTEARQAQYRYSVHGGFEQAARDLHQALLQHPILTSGKPIFFVGHSRGGPLACQLALTWIKRAPITGVYTFDSPRWCDFGMRNLYNWQLWARTYKFVLNNDVVSRHPSPKWGYRHVGRFMYIDSNGQLRPDHPGKIPLRDRIKGRIAHFGKLGTDGVADHSLQDMIAALAHLAANATNNLQTETQTENNTA